MKDIIPSFDCPCAPLEEEDFRFRSFSCSTVFPGHVDTASGGQGPDELCPHRASYACSSGSDCISAYGMTRFFICDQCAVICPTCGAAFCQGCIEAHQADCTRKYEGNFIDNLIVMRERVRSNADAR